MSKRKQTKTPREVLQPALPGYPDEQALEESERAAGVFTAELLATKQPERYKWAAELLAEGSLSERQIAKTCQMSRNSVAAILRREIDRGAIEPAKRQLSHKLLALAHLSVERAAEMVMDDRADISAQQLGILAAVAIDKHQILTGQPTAIVQHVDAPSEQELERLADVIDVGDPAMDWKGEEAPTKADDPAAGAQGAPAAERPALPEGMTDV